MKIIGLFVVTTYLLMISHIGLTQPDMGIAPTQYSTNQTLILIENSNVELRETEPFSDPNYCHHIVCNSDFFYKEILNYDDQKIESIRNQAKSYFFDEFGINIDTLLFQERIEFKVYTSIAAENYRLYFKSGQQIPAEGWTVREGGFVIIFTDPNGVTLGGKQSGKVATPRNVLYYGSYRFMATDFFNYPSSNLTIDYRSSELAFLSDDNTLLTSTMSIFSERGGKGQGNHIDEFLIDKKQQNLSINSQNILTFEHVK